MTYSTEDVSTAVNGSASLLAETLSLGERDSDLLNLLVNATLTRLHYPEATFAEIIRDNYEETEDKVRGWWTNWT